MKERTLFPKPVALGNLSDREQAAYDLLLARPHGVTSTDLGVGVHMALGVPCACSEISACKWAHGDGERVGKKLRDRDAVVKRENIRWTLLPGARPRDTGELPEGF